MSPARKTTRTAKRPARDGARKARRAGRPTAAGGRTTRENLGAFLRAQRHLAGLSLRQLAQITSVSNAYLSQIERGKHSPSIGVLRALAGGLNVSIETLLDQVGLFEDPEPAAARGAERPSGTAAAIMQDPLLSDEQREALLVVYRSYVASNE